MAEAQDIFHIVDALAATELRDVNESITSRQDVDEGTELGDAHNATVVDGTEFSLGRIDDGQDTSLGIFHTPAFNSSNRHDANNAVVVDSNVGAGLLLDGVDDLALRSDDFTDLVHGDVDRDDLRS